MRVDCFALTDVGTMRSCNEDGFVFDPRVGLYAVFDGMGGQSSGMVAVSLATRAFRAFADGLAGIAATHQELEERARTIVRRMHSAIQENDPNKWIGCGTAVVLLAVSDDEALVAHVGDSRAYRMRGGSVEALTEDRSLVEEVRRSGQMPDGTSLAELAKQYSNVVTRCVGYGAELLVDTRIEELHERDSFLLCTDGLWRLVETDFIADVLSDGADASAACKTLVERALAKGVEDNVTAMVVTVRR